MPPIKACLVLGVKDASVSLLYSSHMATQTERIQEALQTSGTTVKAVAQACGITEQAVYAWLKGDTKQISGENLVELAELTGFEARWIAKEVGPKQRIYAKSSQQAHVLKVMQERPEVYSDMIVKIADTVAEQPPNTENGSKKAAA